MCLCVCVCVSLTVCQVGTVEDIVEEAEEWIEGVRSYLDSLPEEDAAEEAALALSQGDAADDDTPVGACPLCAHV